jgi:hypothetical protein
VRDPAKMESVLKEFGRKTGADAAETGGEGRRVF